MRMHRLEFLSKMAEGHNQTQKSPESILSVGIEQRPKAANIATAGQLLYHFLLGEFVSRSCILVLIVVLQWQCTSAFATLTRDSGSTTRFQAADSSSADHLFENLLHEICGQTVNDQTVKLESFGGIRGIAACLPLKRGSDIVRIPISKCWRANDDIICEDDTIAGLCETVIRNLHVDGPYQRLLPDSEEFSTFLPIHWPHTSIDDLELVCSGFGKELASLRQERDDTSRILIDNGHAQDDIILSLDLVQTRTCRVALGEKSSAKSTEIMAPVFDMFNHATVGVNSYYLIENTYGEDFLVIRACDDIDAGQEIFLDYGSSTRPSWRCLLHYGFVPDRISKQDKATISVNGENYEVTARTIPYELVEALSTDNAHTQELVFMPEDAMNLAQLANIAVEALLKSHSSIEQINSLREIQRQVLLQLKSNIDRQNHNLWRSWNTNAWELLDGEVCFKISR